MIRKINFYPYREALKQSYLKRMQIVMLFGFLISASFVYGIYSVVDSYAKSKKIVADVLSKEISSHQEKSAKQLKSVKSQIEFYKKRIEIFDQLSSTRYKILHVLKETTEALPSSVFFERFKLLGDNIILEGYAANNNEVAQLIAQLSNSRYISFGILHSTESVLVGGNIFQSFLIDATFDRKKISSEK